MNYLRVIPRDLFNEAKLLKCLGRIVIESETSRGVVVVEHDGSPFKISLNEDFYRLYCGNVTVTVNGEAVFVGTAYNSKSEWPMWAETEDDSAPVFDDEGHFTPEFLALNLPVPA